MKKSLISLVTLGLGFAVGASALVVLADWQSAPGSPPACDGTTVQGCNAPINVGSTQQSKDGPLIVNFTSAASIGLKVLGSLQIVDNTQAQGSVLMSDANGVGSWVATSSLGLGGATNPSGIPAYYHAQNLSTNASSYTSPMTSSGGVDVASITFTPKSATSNILIQAHLTGSMTGAAGSMTGVVFKNGSEVASSYTSITNDPTYADPTGSVSLSYGFVSGTTQPITIDFRGGLLNNTNKSWVFNLNGGNMTNGATGLSDYLQGTGVSSLDIIDIPSSN